MSEFLNKYKQVGFVATAATPQQDMNLTISKGTRADFKPTRDMYNVSIDFNSFKGAKGTEVIIPDNASPEVRKAAETFNQLVVDFAAKHGYSGYKNRGVKKRSENLDTKGNPRGVANTIHVEPFFTQDAQMEQIVNANIEEFSQLYTQAFGSLPARLVAPHGVTKKGGVVDRGAVSETFTDELTFGNLIIDNLLNRSKQAVSNGSTQQEKRDLLKKEVKVFEYLPDADLDGIIEELGNG